MCEITTLLHQVVKIGHEVDSYVLCFQYGANYGIYELSKTTILENLNINNGVGEVQVNQILDWLGGARFSTSTPFMTNISNNKREQKIKKFEKITILKS